MINPGEIIKEIKEDYFGETEVEEWVKGPFLGKGGFARCHEITNQKTQRKFAAKIISKNNLKKNKHKQKLYSEIKIQLSLKHPNIVQLEHVFEDSKHVYILLELCSNKTLGDLLKRRK